MPAKVWIVDDDASIRWVLAKACERAQIDVELFGDGGQVEQRLTTVRPDAVVTDIRMPGVDGLQLLARIQAHAPDLPVIVMTAHTDMGSALASYQGGAFDYLPKPFDVDDAVTMIKRAVDFGGGRGRHAEDSPPKPTIIGEASSMQEVFRAIGRLAKSNINVLVSGESGTGKELVAQALHRHSPRAAAPFVAINTAAIPAELLESELFGHEKGAFTGAVTRRQGRFEQADGGTLFLDEIGEMPAELQTRLLRVLAEGRFYRVGGRQETEVNVRIIAATNQDLPRRVAEGRFREDLFHRLNVISISMPPLRDRAQDIPALAEHFLQQTARELEVDRKHLTPEALTALCEFGWPGNVRQLENVCRWITVMASGKRVNSDQLPPDIRPARHATDEQSWQRQLRELAELKLRRDELDLVTDLGRSFERTLLAAAIDYTGGHKQEAARRLGWGRNTLARKMKELGLD